jgi:hypothetical protein
MSNGLSSIGALAYQGTNAPTPPNTASYKRAPTVNDYQGFSVGDFWIWRVNKQTNNNLLYVLMGVAGNVADWVLLSTSVGVMTSLHADDGNTATPLAGVINVYGGTGIATTATNGPNTVTISTAGDVATSYITNPATGTAVPVAGVLTFAGTGGAVISAAGSTITVNAGSTGDVTGLHTQDGNTVTATAGIINLSGGNNLTTTGTAGPNTATISLSGITQHSLQVGGAANALTQLGVAGNGYLPIGSAGADPVLATLTAGAGISVTNGAGSITITNTGSGISPANSNSFFAYLSSTQTNFFTGGTFVTVPFDSTVFNNGSNYNAGTNTFTAPVTGYYSFDISISVDSIPNTLTEYTVQLVTTTYAYVIVNAQPYNTAASVGGSVASTEVHNVFAFMNAGDTAYVQALMYPIPPTNCNLSGSASNSRTWFSGYLIGNSSTGAQTFPTDSGTATPNGSGQLDIEGNGTHGSISTTGATNVVHITDINKPAFLATCNSAQNNVTGDATFYLVQFQNAVYNTSSSYNTGTGVFTAPINGIYYFSAVLGIRSLTALFTQASIFINSTAAGYQVTLGNIGAMRDTNNQISMVIDATIPMSAGDTASVTISIAGSTKTLGVSGSGSPWTTWFSGYLMKVT